MDKIKVAYTMTLASEFDVLYFTKYSMWKPEIFRSLDSIILDIDNYSDFFKIIGLQEDKEILIDFITFTKGDEHLKKVVEKILSFFEQSKDKVLMKNIFEKAKSIIDTDNNLKGIVKDITIYQDSFNRFSGDKEKFYFLSYLKPLIEKNGRTEETDKVMDYLLDKIV